MMRLQLFLVIAIITASSAAKDSISGSSKRAEILMRLLNNYDKSELPPMKDNQPVKVEISVYIISIKPPDVGKEEFTVNMYLRQYWKDDRLVWNKLQSGGYIQPDIRLPTSMYLPRNGIWLPDLFIENGKMEKTPNFKLMARSNGDMVYSEQVAITAPCPFRYYHYPVDQQDCILKFRSYALTLADQYLTWHPISNVTIDVDLELRGYEVLKAVDAIYHKTLYSTGATANLDLKFNFTRRGDVHIISAYFPSYVMISASWIQFFLGREFLGIRVLMSLLIFLGILLQLSFVNTPSICALHIWFATCSILAFANLCESGIIAIIEGKEKKRIKVEKMVERPQGQGSVCTLPSESTGLRRDSRAIDFISAVFFPVIFLLFNVFYWLYFTVLV